MSKYGDFLRTQGATEDDVKLLDTSLAQKAYDAQVANIAAAEADAQKRIADFKAETDTWYNDKIVPNYSRMERESAAAKANEARAVALIRASQDEGLRKVAEEMGYKPDGVVIPPAKSTTDFD